MSTPQFQCQECGNLFNTALNGDCPNCGGDIGEFVPEFPLTVKSIRRKGETEGELNADDRLIISGTTDDSEGNE